MTHERYTHGHAAVVVNAHATRTVDDSLAYGLAYLKPGMTVLDVGCGPGTITEGIARRVAPGRVIAVDADASVIAQARDRAKADGVANIDFAVMDAYALDLPDGSVDLAHAHQVLQHLADPVAVLREMARVTRPGGHIAARDGDYSGFVWYPANEGIARWLSLYLNAARANGGEPDAGRRLLAWAHAAGLTDVVSTSSTWTYPAGPGARWWGESWADRILHSSIAGQLLDFGAATQADLEAISASWLEWSADPDAMFMIPHGEIVATVPG